MRTTKGQPYVTCKKCGWVHFQISRKDAEGEVERFNSYFKGLDLKDKLSFGNKELHIMRFERCFLCGGSYKNFRKFREGDCPDGVTLQAIILKDD